MLTCWNADRLELRRVGITPDPRYLGADAAKREGFLKYARQRIGMETAARRTDGPMTRIWRSFTSPIASVPATCTSTAVGLQGLMVRCLAFTIAHALRFRLFQRQIVWIPHQHVGADPRGCGRGDSR